MSVNAPLPPLRTYQRCRCGSCGECRDNEKWDRVFARFEVKHRPERSLFRSTLGNL